MKPIVATIRPEIENNPRFRDAMERLTRFEIHCEARDFGRPAPFLANLFELVAGRPFETDAGAVVRFEGAAPATAHDERLAMLWLRIDTPRGDLAAISGRRISLGERLGALTSRVDDLLTSGRALLVLDSSHRGGQHLDPGEALRVAARYGIPATSIVVLDQNIEADDVDGPILGANAGIVQLWRLLFGPRVRGEEFRAPFGFAAAGPRTRRYPYVSVSHEASAVRANLVARLVERAERGLIAFPKDRFRRNMPGSEAFRAELDRISLFEERGDNHARVEAFLASKGNLVIEQPSNPADRHGFELIPAHALRQSMLSIVCEPQMGPPGSTDLAEAALKSLVAGLPFVVFGAYNAVARLADAGFDVLDDLVDHAYDAEPDPAARFASAWQALETVLDRHSSSPAMSVAEQDRLVCAAAHNRRIFHGPLMEHWLAHPLVALHDRHPLVQGAFAARSGFDGLAPHLPTFVRAHP